ncbi:hypothetical protein MTO96_052364 [Rhipicephalus appendiculatus]
MDLEKRKEVEEPHLFMVARIDFGASSDLLCFPEILTAEILDDIKEKKYQDENCLYLLHRIKGSTARDPNLLELLERRMLEAVGLVKRTLLPRDATTEEVEPPTAVDDSSVESGTIGYIAWSGGWIPENYGYEAHFTGQNFRALSTSDMYPMSLVPRGMCIIINNCNFEDETDRRDGSEQDVRRMESLFKAFLFNCIVHTDKKAEEMRELLCEAAQCQEQEGAQCLVVILMSHGDQDTIQGVDGEALHLINDVYAQFNNENCPALQGKPKLFFIQACRGSTWCFKLYLGSPKIP